VALLEAEEAEEALVALLEAEEALEAVTSIVILVSGTFCCTFFKHACLLLLLSAHWCVWGILHVLGGIPHQSIPQ
jgi:hypothetical protein